MTECRFLEGEVKSGGACYQIEPLNPETGVSSDQRIDDNNPDTGFIRSGEAGPSLYLPSVSSLVEHQALRRDFTRFADNLGDYASIPSTDKAWSGLAQKVKRLRELAEKTGKISSQLREDRRQITLSGEYDTEEPVNDTYTLEMKLNEWDELIVALDLTPEGSEQWEGGRWRVLVDPFSGVINGVAFHPVVTDEFYPLDPFSRGRGREDFDFSSGESPPYTYVKKGSQYTVEPADIFYNLKDVLREIVKSGRADGLKPYQRLVLWHVADNLVRLAKGEPQKVYGETRMEDVPTGSDGSSDACGCRVGSRP